MSLRLGTIVLAERRDGKIGAMVVPKGESPVDWIERAKKNPDYARVGGASVFTVAEAAGTEQGTSKCPE